MDSHKLEQHFEESLSELLDEAQNKLNSVQELQNTFEKNNVTLHQDLNTYKDNVGKIVSELAEIRAKRSESENNFLKNFTELQMEHDQVLANYESLKQYLNSSDVSSISAKEEIATLNAQLDAVREESKEKVLKIKHQYMDMRESMEKEIAELENQLEDSRKLVEATQKDSNDIKAEIKQQLSNFVTILDSVNSDTD